MAVTTSYLPGLLGDNPEARMALREIPVFRSCSEALLALVYRYGRVFSLAEGTELTREGEFDQWVYFIIDGRLDVFLGGEQVDTIASALVGERCILGESRKATLRAAREGVNALGVDMALLDVLNDPAHPGQENLSVYLELIGRIVGEIVQRIADTESQHIELSRRHQVYRRAERVGEIVDGLRHNAFQGDASANFAIYRHLARHEPVLLSRTRTGDGTRVDTRRLFALCLEWGRPAVLYDLAEAVLGGTGTPPAAGGTDGGREDPGGASPGPDCYSAFLDEVVETLLERHRRRPRHSLAAGPPLREAELHRLFALNDEFEVDLRGLVAWLRDGHGYPQRELAEVLMEVLRAASAYNARVNSAMKRMLSELSRIRLVRELERVAQGAPVNVSEFYSSAAPETLISFFSRNLLDVHLIQPCREALQSMAEAEQGGVPSGQADGPPRSADPAESYDPSHLHEGNRALLDSLFD